MNSPYMVYGKQPAREEASIRFQLIRAGQFAMVRADAEIALTAKDENDERYSRVVAYYIDQRSYAKLMHELECVQDYAAVSNGTWMGSPIFIVQRPIGAPMLAKEEQHIRAIAEIVE